LRQFAESLQVGLYYTSSSSSTSINSRTAFRSPLSRYSVRLYYTEGARIGWTTSTMWFW